MSKIVSAEIGFLRFLSEKDGLKQRVELRLLNSKVNRNDWKYENLGDHRALFAGTPILVAYVGGKVGDGHNFDVVKDENGKETASFMKSTAERIVGYFDKESDIRLEVIDGTEWIVGTGYVWVWYAQELVRKLKEQGLEGMSVSIETLIDEMHKDGTTEVFTRYQILGTTILGDDVNPAVKGANIRALSALGGEAIHELTLRVASAQLNNPQKQKSKKGATTMKNFNVEDLRDKFPGYTVLAVNGADVALLSDKGRTAHYVFKDGEETVVPERITNVTAFCSFAGNGEEEFNVPADVVIGEMRERLSATKDALAKETARVNELQTKLNEMEAKEHDRRIEAVKNAIKDQMDKNNAGRECALDESICADLKECLEDYASMVNANGEWIGESAIRKEVDARCMAKIREENASEANRRENAGKRVYAWEIGKGKEAGQPANDYTSVINAYDK